MRNQENLSLKTNSSNELSEEMLKAISGGVGVSLSSPGTSLGGTTVSAEDGSIDLGTSGIPGSAYVSIDDGASLSGEGFANQFEITL